MRAEAESKQACPCGNMMEGSVAARRLADMVCILHIGSGVRALRSFALYSLVLRVFFLPSPWDKESLCAGYGVVPTFLSPSWGEKSLCAS